MISKESRLVNQLMSTIYKEKRDPTAFRIDFDRVVHILSESDILVISQQYSDKLEKVLNKKIVGHAPVQYSTIHAIAKLMYDLAIKMRVDESEIFIHTLMKDAESSQAITQEAVDEWRRAYYGKMSKQERMALADRLQDKLRPDVLDKIRNPR
jgi:hypothetical protein